MPLNILFQSLVIQLKSLLVEYQSTIRAEVEQQLTTMLQQEVSSSPWMAPAVFVRKKNGEVRMCVDYRELNKKLSKMHIPFHVQISDGLYHFLHFRLDQLLLAIASTY